MPYLNGADRKRRYNYVLCNILRGAALIGLVSQILGYGWILNNGFNPLGAIINILAVSVWFGICNAMFKR